ncbi:MAG: GH32 C-terminal domain-containing protein [Pirellulales bacterium]|nr:GH32 C-terminal domain-containing protein [Pirellulales bacterium]
MTKTPPAFTIILVVSFLCFSATMADAETRLLRFPDVHGKRVVFCHGGDIWEASTGGGWAQYLMIFDLASHDARKIAFSKRTERDPMWIGDKIYFVSDRDGKLNLYAYDIALDKAKRFRIAKIYAGQNEEFRYLSPLTEVGVDANEGDYVLAIDGQAVRTATGPNTKPGGSERLAWQSWEVVDLAGKSAVIQIVDARTKGWGHINVDQIIQSDRRHGEGPASREMVVDKCYLHLPVNNTSAKHWMRVIVDGKCEREFQIALADKDPEYWVFIDLSPWKGRKLKLDMEKMPFGSGGLASVMQSDDLPGAKHMYCERYRPQFHFSSRRGWLNDPNGLVYYEGEYHLFYQHNPYETRWGNMTWGHAVSNDLVHWRELPDAIHPDKLGTIYSGSAVVDHNNTTGFCSGKENTIVCMYTSAGAHARPPVPYTQSIAYSNDRGRTLIKYDGNPVLDNIVGHNRDPKVVWHEPSKLWIMALFLDKNDFALFSSPDLKQWRRLCDIPAFGDRECPDFFELPVDGDKGNTRWVFWGAGGIYLLGTFDGKRFEKQSGPHRAKFGGNDYAAQTYDNIPAADGRRIQFAWMNGGKFPGMPFNQQMTVPRVLSLRTTPEGVRLFVEPVEELKKLRGEEHAWRDLAISKKPKMLDGIDSELLDIEAVFLPGKTGKVGLDIRGHKIEYSAAEKQLSVLGKKLPLDPIDGRISLRILVDRTSVEVFANSGRRQMAVCCLPQEGKKSVSVYASDDSTKAQSLRVWKLKSIWHLQK